MYFYFGPRAIWPPGLVVSALDFGTRGPGSILGGHLLYIVFFCLLFSIIMLNYFLQVIWNYINDKKLHSLTFYIELFSISVGTG